MMTDILPALSVHVVVHVYLRSSTMYLTVHSMHELLTVLVQAYLID
jgi:hypothetical protein